jgi:hypothetical protein
MNKFKFNKILVLFLVLFIGISFRISVTRLGHNFDLDSYCLVSEIISHGGNVYSETERYNYGPIWSYFVGLFYEITKFFGRGFTFLGLLISLIITLVDVGIFFVLRKRYGLFTASLFFLNPVSIIISGYHS